MNIISEKRKNQGIWLSFFSLLVIALGFFFYTKFPDQQLITEINKEELWRLLFLIPPVYWSYRNPKLPLAKTTLLLLGVICSYTIISEIVETNTFNIDQVITFLESIGNFTFVLVMAVILVIYDVYNKISWTIMRNTDSASFFLFTVVNFILILLTIGTLSINPYILLGIFISTWCFNDFFSSHQRPTFQILGLQTVGIILAITFIQYGGVFYEYWFSQTFESAIKNEKNLLELLAQAKNLENVIVTSVKLAIPNIISLPITKLLMSKIKLFKEKEFVSFILYSLIYTVILMLIINA